MATSITRAISKLLDNPDVKGEQVRKVLDRWVIERNEHMKAKMDWMQSCLNRKNHEGYRIAYNQILAAIDQDQATQQKLFALLTDFE